MAWRKYTGFGLIKNINLNLNNQNQILALDDLRFQSRGLDPENPHEGYWGCIWGTGRNDVNGIENLSEIRFITEIN